MVQILVLIRVLCVDSLAPETCTLNPDLLPPSTPDDHSLLAPPLPIPNRTVKQQYADDSTQPRV